MTRECYECSFWKPMSQENPQDGECRRNAPLPVLDFIINQHEKKADEITIMNAYWPCTEPWDWCGEFKAKGQPVSEPPQE